MISLGRNICTNLENSSRKEWVETNGIGGYACGTVSGMPTRGYHSLLTAALDVPLNRVVMLAQTEETVIYRGHKYHLSTYQYPDNITPQGYLNIESFRLEPFPIFTFRLADQLLEKKIFMSYGHNLTWIVYRLLTSPEEDIFLTVRPLVSFRGHHLRRQERHFINTHHELQEHVIQLMPDGNLPTLNISHNALVYEHSANWQQKIFYREEHARGLESREDLFSPGILSFKLSDVEPGFLAATPETLAHPDPTTAAQAEVIRRRDLVNLAAPSDDFGQTLSLAADQFLVRRGDGLSIIAGYPWMVDCGREAVIAFQGLTLAMKRTSEAGNLLQTMAGYCSEGILPNHFSEDNSQPRYNSVDAALWFFIAVYHYRRVTGDSRFIREHLWATMEEIILWYLKGTRLNIRAEDDGLINIPEEGAQFTWMDCQVGDWVVTPRSGKPVEVNALWYNALCLMRDLAADFKQPVDSQRYGQLADKTAKRFKSLFWNEKGSCLYDRVEDNFQDATLRPNQLLVLSLPYSLIEKDQAKKVLQAVRRELYTTFGFRSLNQADENYHGTYEGDILKREGATHQGTVWPWFIGPYADALRKIYGETKAVKEEINRMLKPFADHLKEHGLGSISEMFDGDPPHQARGCIASAKSVAEILRVHLELQNN
ncbi:glycogen debranching enzyme family protein [bacterium]|nr:glycogen debranching enzyme family protein [bacterium]